MISILICTRGSRDRFASCIKSLTETCSDRDQVEILVKCDDDGNDTKYAFDVLLNSNLQFKIITTPRGGGYKDLPLFFRELAAMSSGDLIWPLGDDVHIIKGDWVKRLSRICNESKTKEHIIYTSYSPRPDLSKIRVFGGGCPIVSRTLYNNLSRFAIERDAQWDVFIKHLVGVCRKDIVIEIPQIVIVQMGKVSRRVPRGGDTTYVKKVVEKKSLISIANSLGLT